jgi:transposase-like protein
MYTTNAIESINADFRKVTRKGTFPNEQALYKVLYLRITELYRKWNDRPVSNRSLVRNQLLMNESISERFQKYENCH